MIHGIKAYPVISVISTVLFIKRQMHRSRGQILKRKEFTGGQSSDIFKLMNVYLWDRM